MSNAITATKVPDNQRMSFLPAMFGRYMMRGELTVYSYLEQISPDYKGDLWNFYTLSNGGRYMAPSHEKKYRVSIADNYYSGELSADAVGIIATMRALTTLACMTQEDFLIEQFDALRDYVEGHPEGSEIVAAID